MYVLKQSENLEKKHAILLLLLSHRLDSARLGSQLGVVFRSYMVYTSTTLFSYYECLYLQKNADIPGTNSYNLSISCGTSPNAKVGE